MDDAGAMRSVQGVSDFNGDRQCLAERQCPARQARPERLAIEQFHDEKGGALVQPDVMNRADVAMRELRDRARLAIEALAELGVRGKPVRQDFDCDGAIEPRVACFIDLTHPARTDLGGHFIRTEAGARSEGQV